MDKISLIRMNVTEIIRKFTPKINVIPKKKCSNMYLTNLVSCQLRKKKSKTKVAKLLMN